MFHYQHSDDPDDSSPVRPGRYCGPHCDLFVDPDPMDEAKRRDWLEDDERHATWQGVEVEVA